MKKVLTVGVFDYLHYGHINLLKQAKEIVSDAYLIVAVQLSENIRHTKPHYTEFYSDQIRQQMVSAIKYVDEVIAYDNVSNIVKHVEFDIFAVGEDQNHPGFVDAINWCKNNNKQVYRLKRTPNISSTMIKNGIKEQAR